VGKQFLGRTRGDGFAASVTREVALARIEIRQGRFHRSMALITTLSAIASGFEAYLQHERGAFRHWLMWTPVWLTPVATVAGAAAVLNRWAARRLLPAVSLVSLIDGLVGFLYHLRGIQALPGGFKLGRYNVVMGPPVFAPLLTCMAGALGLIASALRRERTDWFSERLAPSVVAERASRGRRHGFVAALRHGEFQRSLALLSAFVAVLAGGEAYVEHLRGSFSQRIMWSPIWLTPPMIVAGCATAVSRRAAHALLPITSVATLFDGLLGFLLHLRGVGRMPGGYANLRFNLTLGPPLFAPLLFSAVGLLGLIASLLRRREGA
jgi:hypothetical protein